MSHEELLAGRTAHMESNAIREILKVTAQPGVISLAGGIPAPESFPVDAIARFTSVILQRYGGRAFQYDLTEGFRPLREALVPFLARKGVKTSPDGVLVTSGSQGALDALGKILVSRGDRVAVEAPTYLGALSAFNPYGPEYVELATDEEGVIPESLEERLNEAPVKLIYLVPTFQNPSGRTLSLERRAKIADIIIRHNALVIEDDPYNDLRYRGEALPALHSWAPDNIIYLGTFSKIFAPGVRVGFAVAPATISRWMVLAKQGTDLHTGTFNQALCAEYLQSGEVDRQIPRVVELYRPRFHAMLRALEEHFPPWVHWSNPDGGMFVWAESSLELDLLDIYHRAVSRNVAYVPGTFFYATPGTHLNTMRLNFTMPDEQHIARAVATLAEVLLEAGEGAKIGQGL
ncbi:aminotransferase-like domain-containing protein [Salinispira pacifica]